MFQSIVGLIIAVVISATFWIYVSETSGALMCLFYLVMLMFAIPISARRKR